MKEYIKRWDCLKVFVQSAENENDIFTKNLSGELHEKHSKKMIDERSQ